MARRDRRADILAAAEREFAAAGFSGGRIERIAAAAGVNKQLLFHYFGSKAALFAAAVSSTLARAEPGGSHAADPVDSVRALLGGVEQLMHAQPGLAGLLADARANTRFPPEASTILSEWRARLLARLVAALVDGQRRGYFRDDIDPEGVAQVALAAALGAGVVGTSTASSSVGGLVSDYCAWR